MVIVTILLMIISNYSVGGHFKLNYHKLLMVIAGYFIGEYWWLF
jgi:hypothetical protein